MDEIIFCDDAHFDTDGELEIFVNGILYKVTENGKIPQCFGGDKKTLFDGKTVVEYGNGFYLL